MYLIFIVYVFDCISISEFSNKVRANSMYVCSKQAYIINNII
jgi:hypothetical protein